MLYVCRGNRMAEELCGERESALASGRLPHPQLQRSSVADTRAVHQRQKSTSALHCAEPPCARSTARLAGLRCDAFPWRSWLWSSLRLLNPAGRNQDRWPADLQALHPVERTQLVTGVTLTDVCCRIGCSRRQRFAGAPYQPVGLADLDWPS